MCGVLASFTALFDCLIYAVIRQLTEIYCLFFSSTRKNTRPKEGETTPIIIKTQAIGKYLDKLVNRFFCSFTAK